MSLIDSLPRPLNWLTVPLMSTGSTFALYKVQLTTVTAIFCQNIRAIAHAGAVLLVADVPLSITSSVAKYIIALGALVQQAESLNCRKDRQADYGMKVIKMYIVHVGVFTCKPCS